MTFAGSSCRRGPAFPVLAWALLTAAVLVTARPASAPAAECWFDTSIAFGAGSFPEAFYPHASARADLDGDGWRDYAVSNHWASAALSVLFHDKAGGYLPPVLLPIGASSNGVAAADFTGDDLPDLLASNTGPNHQGLTVALLRNLGEGAFAPHQDFPAVLGPAAIATGDFDGDGFIDAAVAGYGPAGEGARIAILINAAGDGFLAPQTITVGPAPSDVAVGDLNGDQRPDVVVAREDFRLVVLMNEGGGRFAPPVEYVTQEQPWSGDVYANVALADVDHDLDLDVFCSSNRTQIDADYGAVCLFRNRGDGQLVDRSNVALPRYLGGAFDLALADVTGDSWIDLLTAHGGNGGWVVTPSLGGGEFGAGREYAGGNTPMRIAAEDVDGDGDLDALVLNRYSLTLGVHRNAGDGRFVEPDGRDLEPLCGWMDAGDIDGDLDLDVVSSYAYAGGGGLSVIRNLGAAKFAPREIYAGPRGAMTPRLDDLDGDGDLDLVWAFDPTSPPYDFAVRLNDGGGSFGSAVVWPVGTCGTGDLITMDVDQDGDRDVLLTDYLGCTSFSSPWVWIRRNRGDATFDPPYLINYPTDPKQMAAADFDRDGKEDLATVHADGVKIVRALGAGQFGPADEYEVPDAPYHIVAAELDGDGYPDVATANLRGVWEGTISVFRNEGNGTLGPPVTIPSAFSTEVSAVGQIRAHDVDLDGDADLTLMSPGGQDLLVYENDGNGGFSLQGRYLVGAAPGDYRCLDFDGDGRPDLGAVVGLPPANLNRRFVVARGTQPGTAGIGDADVAPTGQAVLSAAGRNPFSDHTALSFALAQRGPARLVIFDPAGRQVASLLDGVMGAGEHRVTWDGTRSGGIRLAAGVYFARLTTAEGTASRPLILAR